MNKNHMEAIEGTNAIKTFLEQFGPDDIFTEILLEELLMELLSPSYKIENKESREKNETKNK